MRTVTIMPGPSTIAATVSQGQGQEQGQEQASTSLAHTRAKAQLIKDLCDMMDENLQLQEIHEMEETLRDEEIRMMANEEMWCQAYNFWLMSLPEQGQGQGQRQGQEQETSSGPSGEHYKQHASNSHHNH